MVVVQLVGFFAGGGRVGDLHRDVCRFGKSVSDLRRWLAVVFLLQAGGSEES